MYLEVRQLTSSLKSMTPRIRVLRGLFYGGLGLLVLSIMSGLLDEPSGIGKHVIRNDEGYAFALLLAGWIEFVRPRLAASPRRWHVTLTAAVVFVSLGFLIQVGTPGSVATMNETLFACSVLFCYFELARPLPPWAWALPALAIMVAAVAGGNNTVAGQAETLAAFVLIPASFDFVDRSVLEAEQARRWKLLGAWMGFLAVAVVVLHILRPTNPQNLVEDVLLFCSRMPEVAIAVLLLHTYFVALDRLQGTAARVQSSRFVSYGS
jgi:hypothetical protein